MEIQFLYSTAPQAQICPTACCLVPTLSVGLPKMVMGDYNFPPLSPFLAFLPWPSNPTPCPNQMGQKRSTTRSCKGRNLLLGGTRSAVRAQCNYYARKVHQEPVLYKMWGGTIAFAFFHLNLRKRVVLPSLPSPTPFSFN